MPLVVITSKFEGPLVLTEPTTINGIYAGVSLDFEIKEWREVPVMSTQGEGTLAISTSAPASSSKPVRISVLPSLPSTIVAASGMVFVSCEFLHSLVDSKRVITTRLENVDAEVASFYGQI